MDDGRLPHTPHTPHTQIRSYTSMPQVAVPDCSFLFYPYILYTPELTQNHLTLSPLLPLSYLLLQDGLASVPGRYFAPKP